ncbi:MAG TPA: hypothetical protein VGH91_13700 [Gammaproteobacteria bacterium]|jgi:hypothetical protein
MYLDIYEAIEHRHLIQVYYGHYCRIVEPHVYGRDLDGRDVLKVYQLAGCDELGRHIGWRWLRISKMQTLTVLGTSFPSSRSTDGARPRTLQRVYCEITSSRHSDGEPSDGGSPRHR